MELIDIMKYKSFTVVGDVCNKDKFAYKIVNTLKNNNYDVTTVTKEESLNNVGKIEVINLCINPNVGLKLLKEFKKDYKIILIQPGACNDELLDYLKIKKMVYLQGCSLVGVDLINRN